MNIQIPGIGEPPSSAAVRAGGSSFYFAMRILPRERREAMFEIYAFCRAVDDIADGAASRTWRMQRLAEWRQDIDVLYRGKTPKGLEGLATAIARFDLRREDFHAVIDGMEMDAREDIRAPSFETLDLYCDRVASAVGRLSVRAFGMEEQDGRALAHHLGRALQMTNILRDIDEDAAAGRLYLPKEGLALADIGSSDPEVVAANPRLGAACDFLAYRAREHFAKANEIMARNPRRAVRAPKIMGEVYRQLLEDMIARGWARPRMRARVQKSHLLWIALRHAFV
jgi:presqualene diphosphate synthase